MRAIARVYRQAFGAAKGKTANVSVGGRAKMLPPRTLATLALIAIVAHAPSGAAQGTTVLMVTHNHELASRCDRIVELVDGRIVTPVTEDAAP